MGREKRVTPEFGEYRRRKILPLKFRVLQHLPDLVIIELGEAMEERSSQGVDDLRGKRDHVLGVAAVVEHHEGPVLAQVHYLDGTIHLGGPRGLYSCLT
jgi:hypothetical protein